MKWWDVTIRTSGATRNNKHHGSNYYSVVGNPSNNSATLMANSTALCQPGDVAVSGEYNITSPTIFPTFQTPVITYFGSLGSDPPTNWNTQLFAGTFSVTVVTTVNCFDNPPLRP
jgi:hypothetical protein